MTYYSIAGYRRGRTDYAAIRDEANNVMVAPVGVSAEEYDDMLGCVPPIYVTADSWSAKF